MVIAGVTLNITLQGGFFGATKEKAVAKKTTTWNHGEVFSGIQG